MPTHRAAPVIRSGFSPWNTWRKPSPSVPTSRSAGTRTLSKNSVNCLSGIGTSTGSCCAVSPGASVSTRNSDICAVPLTEVPVRVTTRIASACSTPEMKYFWPLMTHSDPSRTAVVEILCELVPASGSVIAKTIFPSPEASRGSHCACCAGVPNLPMTSAAMPHETRVSSSGQPCAAVSSQTIASSTMPAPPPPYSSAMLTPRKPCLPSALHSSCASSRACALRV